MRTREAISSDDEYQLSARQSILSKKVKEEPITLFRFLCHRPNKQIQKRRFRVFFLLCICRLRISRYLGLGILLFCSVIILIVLI